LFYIDENRRKAVERVAEEARAAQEAARWSNPAPRSRRRQSSLWGDYSAW